METVDIYKITKENVVMSEYDEVVRIANFTNRSVTPIVNDKRLMALTKDQRPLVKFEDSLGNVKFVAIGPDFDELLRVVNSKSEERIRELESELEMIRLDQAMKKQGLVKRWLGSILKRIGI